MKTFTAHSSLVFAPLLVAVSVVANAESKVPQDALSVVNMSLEAGQAKLQQEGYEIADSSFFGGKQLWWNEGKKECIELKFDKSDDKKITSVEPGNEKKCIKGAEASRKVWESYRDGQAPASSAGLDAERAKLSDAGYKPSYWIKDVAPGKDAETWYNGAANKCMRLVWSSADGQNMKSMECKPEQGVNPAPK